MRGVLAAATPLTVAELEQFAEDTDAHSPRSRSQEQALSQPARTPEKRTEILPDEPLARHQQSRSEAVAALLQRAHDQVRAACTAP